MCPWIPVDQALPSNTRRVLFAGKERRTGKRQTWLGFYARPREIEADWGDDSSYDECEEDDNGTMWLMEGWYEDAYICGYLGAVLDATHWMEIPPLPRDDA